jgi:hypothetical protein
MVTVAISAFIFAGVGCFVRSDIAERIIMAAATALVGGPYLVVIVARRWLK